jgi:ATP-binding cassette subfamily B protein
MSVAPKSIDSNVAAAQKAAAARDAVDFEEKGKLDRSLFKRLLGVMRPQRGLIASSLALLLFGQALRILQPLLVALAIDLYIAPHPLSGRWADVAAGWQHVVELAEGVIGVAAEPLALLAFALLGLVFAEFFTRRLQVWLLELAGQNALRTLRQRVFAHLQSLASSFYDRTPVGRLIGRVTTDIEALQELFSTGVVTILGDLVNIAVMTVVLFLVDSELATVSLCVVPLFLIVTSFVRTRVRRAQDTFVTWRSKMAAFLHEHIVGMAIVQSSTREADTRARFGVITGEMLGSQLTVMRLESWLSAIIELLGSFTTALILWYGGGMIAAAFGVSDPASTGLTVGTLFFFVDLMGRFFGPLTDLTLKITVLQNAASAASKVFRLLDHDERIEERAGASVPRESTGRIEFRAVRFAYPTRPGEDVLRGLDFVVEPGERVAIVGSTGSGKSTVLRLLTRLYDVTGGAILVDGVDVRDQPLAGLRARIAVVHQDVFLFEGTVLDNLRLSRHEISAEDALLSARRLNLDRVVARLDKGFDTVLSERGRNLSAGERQLIAFARTMAAAPHIVLMDEATSNIDTHTEELLAEAVDELLASRTSLTIAHRLSTVRHSDRILVMDKGRLVEQGSHDELMARGGRYRELYERQYETGEK